MSRIKKRFAALKAEGRAGLVAYLTAGDPDLETSTKLFEGVAKAGADLIEIGMPFSDPMADGPLIQAAGMRALKSGVTLKKTLALVEHLRARDPDTPYVLMGYYNPIYRYGAEAFARDAAAAGVDGVIIVDLPPEEETEFAEPAQRAGLDLVRLATPTSDEYRLPVIVEHASGFVYYVAIAGITGTRAVDTGAVREAVARLRRFTDLPVAVGFGIKNPDQAAEVARAADAAAVGSALVERLAQNLDPAGKATPGLVDGVLGDIAALAKGIRGARIKGSGVLDHVTFAVTDLARSRAFYDRALQPLGLKRITGDDHAFAGYGVPGKGYFWIGLRDQVPSGAHVAFAAPDRTTVRAFYEAGIAAGGRDNGKPGLRPQYAPTYYGAFVLDPDGHNIEAVCYAPAE